MANPIPETMDKTQGLVAEQEGAQAAVPIPTQPTPPLQAAPTPAPAAAQAAPQQQQAAPFTPTSYMQTIPANILFQQGVKAKTDYQRRVDMSIFWRSLSARPGTPPIMRAIARELAGK